MPRRLACDRPLPYGRCVLSVGHRGYHWDGGSESAPPPDRSTYTPKVQGSVPMHGTLDDVGALKKHVRAAALRVVREGARLPDGIA